MSHRNTSELWQELAIEEGEIPEIQPRSPLGKSHTQNKPKPRIDQALARLAQADGGRGNFDFTYQAARHEKAWISESLGDFFEHRWIDDVLRLVKGGKEATVYLCQGSDNLGDALVAGKVYRPTMFRSLKNDYIYREGREELDEGGHKLYKEADRKAIRQRSSYGRQVMRTSWLEHELLTLNKLYDAGVDVPKPYTSGHNAILMQYIGDENMPASPLAFIKIDPDEAQQLFPRVVHNIELMLSQDRIHADLSAYNILYWDGDIWLIDFPQAIEPEANPSAYRIFQRDILRVCEYFSRHGVRCQPHRLAADLWTAFHHRLTPEIHPAYLDAEDEKDVAIWKAQNKQ
ncbi:MAG: hypothetical protein MUC85_00265 [Anaerolineales bacterium]|nr:hypothetical protein [Anaerolineales bacterium]